MLLRMCFFVFLLVTVKLVNAQQICDETIPASTPTDRFVDNMDGTVSDKQTGLMWAKCSGGQTRENNTCIGMWSNIRLYTWLQALDIAENSATLGGYTDWRVPNVKELASLIEDRCYNPSINLEVFPNTASQPYWTSSAKLANKAYMVNFEFGGVSDGVYFNNNAYNKWLRIVRSID